MKRAISSGSRPKDPSFSLNSNMESSREPMPRARRDAREYVCPLRNVTVLSFGSNSEQNLTIRTCTRTGPGQHQESDIKKSSAFKLLPGKWAYLESARFEQHDLIMLAQGLEAWDALCKLHHFFHGRGEALRERLPDLLAGATGWCHGAGVEWTSLQGKWRGLIKELFPKIFINQIDRKR